MKEVTEILDAVRRDGDKAVLKYSKVFDKNPSKKFELSRKQIKEAYEKVDAKTIQALKYAALNIKRFAKTQMKQVKGFKMQTGFGVLEQKVVPISRVGCYVPGGNYPLPSTALMTVIPAKVSGVKEVIVCSPKISPFVIVASDIAGADRIFNIGGVQAIGAMAYGTKQIPRVDKIVGPGNKYVAEAKRQVFGQVGIDFIAGPSEVLVVADKDANPKTIAADLLAQAEHDTNAKTTLITTSTKVAKQVGKEIKTQLNVLATKEIAGRSIKNLKVLIAKNLADAASEANKIAPEHLELQIKNPKKVIGKFYNYGAMFLGENSAEALGDYCLGPNHTLPTNGAAKYAGGLSVREFVKILTVQKVRKADKKMVQTAAILAEVEGLAAHKRAALLRLKK